MPVDVVELAVERPGAPLRAGRRPSEPAALAGFREAAGVLLAGAPPPTVLADVFVARACAQKALQDLIDRGDLRYASLLWGRRVVDESSPRFLGTYIGAASAPEVRDAVEGAERLVTAGVLFTDLTSGFFSAHLDESRRIELGPYGAVVAGTRFDGIEMADALAVLADLVEPAPAGPLATAPAPVVAPVPGTGADPLSQRELWDTVAASLVAGDLVLADQGTSFYGLGPHHLPHDTLFVGQPLWASIGYTLPALLGAALAAPTRRPVLLIGDGAAQMTIAELATLIRARVPAIMVVVDNDGYTVERAIHGRHRAYNDIASWRWSQLPAAFGAGEDEARGVRVTTADALAAALGRARDEADRLTLIQAVTGPLDVPPLLTAVAAAAARANASGEATTATTAGPS